MNCFRSYCRRRVSSDRMSSAILTSLNFLLASSNVCAFLSGCHIAACADSLQRTRARAVKSMSPACQAARQTAQRERAEKHARTIALDHSPQTARALTPQGADSGRCPGSHTGPRQECAVHLLQVSSLDLWVVSRLWHAQHLEQQAPASPGVSGGAGRRRACELAGGRVRALHTL